MGSCFSKSKRSDAAVIHNASPRISHDFTPNEQINNVSKDSLPNFINSSTEVAKHSPVGRSPPKNSKTNNISPPGEHVQEHPATREGASIPSSGLVASSGVSEAVTGRRSASLLRETDCALPAENLSSETQIPAQRDAVKSPASNILPAKEPFGSNENQSTIEASPQYVLDRREEDAPVSPSTGSLKLSMDSVDPPFNTSSGFCAEVGGYDSPDGNASIHPEELDRNPKEPVFDSRNAVVDCIEGFTDLKPDDKCKHLDSSNEPQEAQRTVATRPASKLKRSRSADHIMDSDTNRPLRRRSSEGSTGELGPFFFPRISHDEGCQKLDVLDDGLRSGAVVPSTGYECEADREKVASSWDVHDLWKMKTPESIHMQRTKFAESEVKEIDRGMEAAVEQDRRLARICEGISNSKVKETGQERTAGEVWELGCEHQDNLLSADFFELKNRYLCSCATTAALVKAEQERADDCGTNEAKSQQEEGLSGTSLGGKSTAEMGEDEDEFLDITAGVSFASYADAQGKKEGSQIIAFTTSDDGVPETFELMLSTVSPMNAVETTTSAPSRRFSTKRLIPASQQLSFQNMEEDCESDSETFEFKHAVSIFSQENMPYVRGRAIEEAAMQEMASERNDLREAAQFPQRRRKSMAMAEDDEEEDELSRFQELSVVSTGDAVLFSGSNLEEFHLIPSKSYLRDNSSSIILSPKFSQMQPSHRENVYHRQEQSTLSIEDIILLLENDELDEEELLSFLISAKSSSPASDAASESSFEFKVMSSGSTPHSTPSTPMLSAGSTPRRITQLKPIALTPEEIAEIWGVFEQRQALAS